MNKYLPLSQIKSNLYTKGGEFYVKSNQQLYKGYYYKTSTGQYYSGKTPQDKPSVLLVSYKEEITDIDTPFITNTNNSVWSIQEINYQKDVNPAPTTPTSTYPNPKQSDYKLGEFERYFLSKNNEIKFKEVNLFTYNQYLTKDPSVSFQIFSPIKLSWGLTGNREKTYTINYNTVKRISLNLKLRGFVEYFQGRFTQFYKEIGD
jgi:hypothetical protein